jgi:hypothetical protein
MHKINKSQTGNKPLLVFLPRLAQFDVGKMLTTKGELSDFQQEKTKAHTVTTA